VIPRPWPWIQWAVATEDTVGCDMVGQRIHGGDCVYGCGDMVAHTVAIPYAVIWQQCMAAAAVYGGTSVDSGDVDGCDMIWWQQQGGSVWWH
jgi:hypothetical protein